MRTRGKFANPTNLYSMSDPLLSIPLSVSIERSPKLSKESLGDVGKCQVPEGPCTDFEVGFLKVGIPLVSLSGLW